MSKIKCEGCFWFAPNEGLHRFPWADGSCRRYPPARIGGGEFGFPPVKGKWGCGEFKKDEPETQP